MGDTINTFSEDAIRSIVRQVYQRMRATEPSRQLQRKPSKGKAAVPPSSYFSAMRAVDGDWYNSTNRQMRDATTYTSGGSPGAMDGYIRFDARFGDELTSIVHDPTETDVNTNGNFTVVEDGFYLFQFDFAFDFTINALDYDYTGGAYDQEVITSTSNGTPSHTHNTTALNWNWVKGPYMEWVLRRKPDGGAMADYSDELSAKRRWYHSWSMPLHLGHYSYHWRFFANLDADDTIGFRQLWTGLGIYQTYDVTAATDSECGMTITRLGAQTTYADI